MDIDTFIRSLSGNEPPHELNKILQALWKAEKGEWVEAHELVQDDPSRNAAWVHAYLHRVEGDQFNASYWYQRAGKPIYSGDLKAEWDAIVQHFLHTEG